MLPMNFPFDGLIMRVETIHGEKGEMVLRCVAQLEKRPKNGNVKLKGPQQGEYVGRTMTIIGTGSHVQGEYLWLSKGLDGSSTLQRCLNAS